MSGRDPDAILAELGRDLRAGWASPRGRRNGGRGRPAAVAVLAALVLVPTAVATRDVLFAPGPPPLPDVLRPPGAVAPARAGAAVYVATGVLRGVAWRLSAMACDYGDVRAIGVFLDVPGGGAGARCDIATRVPGVGPSPESLARRRVQTYFDPVARRTWVFGALPAEAESVSVNGDPVALRAVDERAAGRAALPGGMRVFVTALDGAVQPPAIVVHDAAGATLPVGP